MESDSEVEIDLRRYVGVLVRRWPWIVGLAVIAAVIGLGAGLLQPPAYEATALVAITKPNYTLNFDDRIETTSNIQPAYKAYPELARSDEILQQLFTALEGRPKSIDTLDKLRDVVRAEAGADPSLVRLKVQVEDANEAARIVNTWAGLFMQKANALYGTQDQQQVQFFESQLAATAQELKKADQALIDYEARDTSSSLASELKSIQQKEEDYLSDQRSVSYLLQDIGGLRAQLTRKSAASPAGLADRLSTLFLQIKAYRAQASVPIQLQFSNPDSLASASVADQIAFLDDLTTVMQVRLDSAAGRLQELEPQILSLQKQVQQASSDKDALMRNREVAHDTYMTLAQKTDEARIAAQNTKGSVQVASRAEPPSEPISGRKLVSILVGGVVGLLLGVLAAFIVEWRQKTAVPARATVAGNS